ncbi:MAG: hypothetical protein WAW06_00960 [bacterium]
MSSKPFAAIVALALILVVTATSFAFDGNRKGFVIGFGAGLGYTSHKNSVEHLTEGTTSFERLTHTGAATDIRVGYGFSEGVILYYVNKVNWLKAEWEWLEDGKEYTTAVGIGGVGVSYYLDPESPLYLTAALPVAGWIGPFENNMDTLGGLGFSAGAGYELAKHLSVEAQLFYGRPSDNKEPLTYKSNMFGMMITVNGLLY